MITFVQSTGRGISHSLSLSLRELRDGRGGRFREDQPRSIRRDSSLRARGIGAYERVLLGPGVEVAAFDG